MKQLTFIKFSYLRNFFLVALYIVFFSVELLYNFDSGKKPDHHPAMLTFSCAVPDHTVKSNKPMGHDPTHFRLNKRFHPSFIASGNIIAPDIFAGYINRNYSGNYSSESLFNIFLLGQSRRAPPVA